jgi:hypothetical protein
MRVKEAEMKRWGLLLAMLLSVSFILLPGVSAAEEIAYRAVYHVQKVETVEVGDVPGHVVGFSVTPGLIFMTKGPAKGEIGTRKAITSIDIMNGKGSFTGYYTYTFPDGSTMYDKASGTFTSVDGGKKSALEGTVEFTRGTGKFAGMKGKGTFKGERVGPPEAGGDGYVDITGTIGK